MWIYLWLRPSLNRGRKTKPKKRNEESKLLLPQLEVCVVRVGGICTGCEGWGGGWWMADGGCGCGWGCGWGYCAAAAARATARAHKNALNKICHINLAIYMFVFGGECAACSSPKNVIYRPNALENK